MKLDLDSAYKLVTLRNYASNIYYNGQKRLSKETSGGLIKFINSADLNLAKFLIDLDLTQDEKVVSVPKMPMADVGVSFSKREISLPKDVQGIVEKLEEAPPTIREKKNKIKDPKVIEKLLEEKPALKGV